MSDRDPYKVLQVDREAVPEVITAAYRALARRLHPDRDASGVAEIRMAELNRAYAILRNPARRREHDAAVAAEAATQRVPVGPGEATPPARGRFEGRHDDAQAGEAKLDFGRYTGWSLREIARQDPDYLRWLSRHSSGIRFRRAIAEILPEGSGEAAAKPTRR
jgi:curved DNA-binding protein CbpA